MSELSPEEKFFLGPCVFYWGATSATSLPDAGLPEIAFAGRSNVGKSSLLNALVNRKILARTSSMPGRTQQINFFNLGDRLALVDMPGYGYAQVSKSLKQDWKNLIYAYLRGRQTLQCALVLIDSRHGLKDLDRELMKMLDGAAVSYRIVLTKADKADEVKKVSDDIREELKQYVAAFPDIFVTSVEKKIGIEELRAFVASYAAPPKVIDPQ